jgi:hypothetical protein
MLKKYIIVLFIGLLYNNTSAQQTGVIYGRITDAYSKQPLTGANVIVMGTDFGAAADAEGNYRISGVPVNTYQIRASIIGYKPMIKTDIVVNASRPFQVDFELMEETIQLEDVTVRADYFYSDPTELISTRSFGYEEIRRAPGGFEDVVRALSVLPGVGQAEAGRNDLIVRGGAPSENLYIVDGIEVPNINHFGTQGASGGPLSYINLDYIKEVSFSTGGFSSAYGDKISSALRIDLKDGRDDRLGGKATISATQFGLNFEGPIGEKNNFLISARRSYLDLIFKAAGFGFVPEYYDLITKADFEIDRSNSISFLYIGAFDNVRYFNDTEDQRYDNSRILGSDQLQYTTGLNYQHIISNGFFNIILSRVFVDYDTRQNDSLLNPIFRNKSLEAENSIRADLVYKISPHLEVNAGAASKHVKFNADVLFPPFLTTFGETLPVNSLVTEEEFNKSSAYINFNHYVFDRLRFNIGGRVDYFDPLEKQFYFSPRLSASYKLTELTSLNASGGIYYQSPAYLWLAVNGNRERLKNIRADQLILGMEHLLREDLLIKTEVFQKNYSDYPVSLTRPYLILANTGAGYTGSEDNFSAFGLEPLTSTGKGNSRGAELSVQKKLSDLRFYGIFSLTYSETDFIPLDDIQRPGAYDQRWLMNLSGGYKFDQFWEASLKFRYATGRPYTPYEPDGSQLVSNYLSDYLDPLHSLDLRVDKRWYLGRYTLITYIDVQNVYNNTKSNFIRWDPRTKTTESASSIGILPSIGVSFEF